MLPGMQPLPFTRATADERVEWLLCRTSAAHFLNHYAHVHNPDQGGWVPFRLWPRQEAALSEMERAQHLIVLKARQLGLTWLCLGYALWRALCHPPAAVLLFSRREAEARHLLHRLRGMHDRLPPGLQSHALRRAACRWELSNGSTVFAFPTSGARSYTGTLAIVDEADFVPDLAAFLNSVKPTVDAGGQLFLISTPDKARPLSPFKRLYRAAAAPAQGDALEKSRAGAGYRAVFLPWHAHPGRTYAWYLRVQAELRAQRGSDDDLHQEYPATPEEALRLRALAARLSPVTVAAVLDERPPLPHADLPANLPGEQSDACRALPGLALFALPLPGRWYAAGADPAEGNPHSDESALCLLDGESGAQVALLAARLPVDHFAHACARLCTWYNDAPLLVERNNHGHAVLIWLAEHGVQTLAGPDGRPGWQTTAASKHRLWDEAARLLGARAATMHDTETAAQMAAVEATTLRAPAGLHDDRAMAFVLALAARERARPGPPTTILPPDPNQLP